MEINVTIDGEYQGCPEAGWFQHVVEQALKAQDASPDAEVGLLITGQEKIKELNKTYRGMDRPTDVLAFYLTTGGESERFVVAPDGLTHLGDVVVSCPQAALQAQEHGHSIRKELAILIIHGVLHILGYDHEKPDQKHEMVAREKDILSKILIDLEGKQ